MTSCDDCVHFKCYRGSRDRYGIQQEPDVYDCTGNATEDELDRFFTNCEEWEEDSEGCQAFELSARWWGDE